MYSLQNFSNQTIVSSPYVNTPWWTWILISILVLYSLYGVGHLEMKQHLTLSNMVTIHYQIKPASTKRLSLSPEKWRKNVMTSHQSATISFNFIQWVYCKWRIEKTNFCFLLMDTISLSYTNEMIQSYDTQLRWYSEMIQHPLMIQWWIQWWISG